MIPPPEQTGGGGDGGGSLCGDGYCGFGEIFSCPQDCAPTDIIVTPTLTFSQAIPGSSFQTQVTVYNPFDVPIKIFADSFTPFQGTVSPSSTEIPARGSANFTIITTVSSFVRPGNYTWEVKFSTMDKKEKSVNLTVEVQPIFSTTTTCPLGYIQQVSPTGQVACQVMTQDSGFMMAVSVAGIGGAFTYGLYHARAKTIGRRKLEQQELKRLKQKDDYYEE